MGLSRLDNFLKSVRGNVLYVDPNSIDATDSIENTGNSLTRPFKTIQRALIEASRWSYQRGLDNDRFEKTTIILYPGDHIIDNRPGWIPDFSTTPNNYLLRSGETSTDFSSWDLTTNYDLETSNNALYKLNSVHGGVIIPRGTSIVGLDLRKTRIRPKYVPNPLNDNIERSALFRVTGACYLWQFTVLDASPNNFCYKDYTTNTFVPNFSHHKLTAFEYADGVNNVVINDDFISNFDAGRTDLDIYYEKVGLVYGSSSGREIQPDYPSTSLDIQPKIDEYRIVGSRGNAVGITSIKSGDGVTSSTNITVTFKDSTIGLDVDTPIQINGVGSAGYDGQFVVSQVNSPTEIVYQVSAPPQNPLPSIFNASLSISVDTVSSASPYIFNVSMRSVYGMCGLHADGNKADGFKSMVVAQFTGIGLQKDDNAFVKYDSVSGTYADNTESGNENIHTDSLARFKPAYENYHIKCSNNAYLQLVSVFAIGFANHFLAESGGDQSINNSNSNFGAKSLVASGFRKESFPRDDVGYITHVIPPKELETTDTTVEFLPIDVGVTTSVGISSHLYLYEQKNIDSPPEGVLEGYRLGAKVNETINVLINNAGVSTEYSASVVMPYTTGSIGEKKFIVGRNNVGINSVTNNNTLRLTSNHTFINGESIRIISSNGQLPDGLDSNQVYYAITNSVSAIDPDQIKIAQTFNDAVRDIPITINTNGGRLDVVSRVSDKKSGDVGHPIQWDSLQSQWYVNVSTASTANNIYSTLNLLGVAGIGAATARTYIKRRPDTRNVVDTIYRLRYVIPSDSPLTSRPPLDGYVIQESNTSIGSTNTEVSYQFNPSTVSLSNSTELRNQRIVANASWNGSSTATIITELPHDLSVGSEVEIVNVTSTNNTSGASDSGFNGTFVVSEISNTKEFKVALSSNPGTFTNDTSIRTTNLPYFKKKKFVNTYYIYRSQEVQKYVPGKQDGIYHLFVVNSSNRPTVQPFNDLSFSQPIQNLYPQTNRDNPNSDPKPSVSHALSSTIGQVVINDPQNSITKETLNKQISDYNIGIGLTDIVSSVGVSATTHTLYAEYDHGLNRVTTLSIVNPGAGYGDGSASQKVYYNAKLVNVSAGTTGFNATARVTVSAAGTISAIKIMDGGSAYSVGDQLNIVGIATTTSFSVGIVSVTRIYNNIGDTLFVSGIPDTHEEYNNVYRIVGISSSKTISVVSSNAISTASTTGLGANITANSNATLSGQTLNVSSLVYNNTVGLATVTTVQNHGLIVDNKVRLGGAENSLYNGDFIVKRVIDLNNFVVNVGIRTNSPATTGNKFAYRPGFVANGGNILKINENLGGRQHCEYAGITTTLGATVSDPNSSSINITNATLLDLNIGDYLLVDEEIVRIKTTVTTSNVEVFRGLLGTRRSSHISGSVVRRVRPRPIELRRNSLIRASGHTFEYLGFGPGNYSTAFPERQDRSISAQEELLSQATKVDGGIVVFTGMNADGDFYVGNKKVSSTTGQEEVFDTPIPTVTGEDPGTGGVNIGFDVLTPLEVSISRSVKVEGGPDANIISEFDGPVIFNNKITSTSPKGIEANSVYVQGNESVSRKLSISKDKPILAGNYGDINFNSEPSKYNFVGWTYVTDNKWEPFGFIGGSGVGIASAGKYIGFSTTINIVATGFTFTVDYDSVSGVSTLTWNGDPRIAISTGPTNNLLGRVRQLNFVGGGITVSGDSTSGIATIQISTGVGAAGSNPGQPFNSLQWNNNDKFAGVPIAFYDDAISQLRFGSLTNNLNSVFFNNAGSVGFATTQPTSKVEIVADNETSLYIKSTSGTDIVRIDNTSNDSTPFIVDANGRVGINTITTIAPLDVVGNAAITGAVRIYETDRSNYVGLQVGSLSSNLTFTLPTSYGSANQVLTDNGSGTLSWTNVSRQNVSAGNGISLTNATSGGITTSTITNTGVTKVIAGAGVSVTPTSGTGEVTISASGGGSANLYPFTTRGFGMVL